MAPKSKRRSLPGRRRTTAKNKVQPTERFKEKEREQSGKECRKKKSVGKAGAKKAFGKETQVHLKGPII
jgi:hypothetical protein